MHRDRLSGLPLTLIHHILSFLPFRDVVKTTVISKHWVNLWTTVPCISIYENDEEDEDKLKIFANRALILWKGAKILKFGIQIEDSSLEDDARIWILFALKNKVEVLELCISPTYLVPQDLYSCSSIRELSLLDCVVQCREAPSWNQLKSLTVCQDFVDEDLINRIMSGSPVLEVFELRLGEYCENMSIMSKSLKWLKIVNDVSFVGDQTSLSTLRICCPNLETLKIRGLFGKCLFTDVSSLTDATFGFLNNVYRDRDLGLLIELLGEVLEQIFSTIQNVENLELTDLCVQAFGASRKKYLLSPLPNVKFLELEVLRRSIEFGDIIDLLGIFPNLKNVKFEGLDFRKPHDFNTAKYMEFETSISKSFLLQLKIVEINIDLFDSSVSGFIKFLLKHAVILKKLVIRPDGITLRQHKRFSEKLLSMPRSSPTAQVILKSD